ncbi:MAG: fibronectin/fibrinogen-binding protein [Clostridia bacterium]|nr:fibronectin/fibrinogen-binding protein [Clostridia bacterium]
MAFDGFVLSSVVEEFKTCLIGGKVQKIYEPTNHEILLSIYANGLQYALCANVSSNLYSVFLTTSKKENPLVAPNFCMLLRKHLMGYKIINISTMQLERILTIEFTGNNEEQELVTKKLIIELMGKYSNILLLDEKNNIIDSLKHFSTQAGANRDILPKAIYQLPSTDKIDISLYSSLETAIEETQTSLSSFFVTHFIGISKTLILHIISSLNLEDTLSKENYQTLASYLLDLKTAILQKQVKCILLSNKDYTLVPSLENNQTLQINFFLDNYYLHKEQEEQFLNYRNQLLNFILGKLKKISKKLSVIDEKLKECNHIEEYKLYGELLTSYLYQISKEHISHIELLNYYNNSLIDIPLDISLSPAENAKKYFKKYHKLKNTFTIVHEQKLELEKEINYLESIVYEIEVCSSLKELDGIYEEIQDAFMLHMQKHSKKKPLKKKSKKVIASEPIVYQIQDFKVLIGKNNRQNDELTFKIAKKDDIWFHVKDVHGSHTILITNGKQPSQDIINECANLAAVYSKANNSSNVPVDYTFIKYVKKPNKAKPGMVIYTNQQTVNVNPIKRTSSAR